MAYGHLCKMWEWVITGEMKTKIQPEKYMLHVTLTRENSFQKMGIMYDGPLI
jgi:hypothetical protein